MDLEPVAFPGSGRFSKVVLLLLVVTDEEEGGTEFKADNFGFENSLLPLDTRPSNLSDDTLVIDV